MAFYKTTKMAITIDKKVYAIKCDKTVAVFSKATAFGNLDLRLVQECDGISDYNIIDAKSGLILIKDCGKLSVRGFHNICECISFLAADKIIEKSKKSPAIEDLPEKEE